MSEAMFETATRMKLRFPYRGQCSAEDLWDLSLRELDAIYKALSRQAKDQEGDSLLDQKTQENTVLELQIDIVKHIVAVKLAEQEERKAATDRAARKQQLLAIMQDKQEAQLRELSIEELQALVSEL